MSYQGHLTDLRLWVLSLAILLKNGRTDVCLSVGMWRANGNLDPCTDLDEILHTYPQGRFWSRFDPRPLTPWASGLETLKAEGHIFKVLSRLQINPRSTGYLSYLIILTVTITPKDCQKSTRHPSYG